MARERISINSLLNDQEPEPIPRSATPSATGSCIDSESSGYVREEFQTPTTMDHSPSPTLSQISISSDNLPRTTRALKGHHRSLSESSGGSGRMARAASLYAPYEQSQRSKHGKGSRQFRPGYNVEESYFIWYHRLDLDLDWSQITARFNDNFTQKRHGCQGFQCKFYRFLQEHGLPSVRERKRDPSDHRKYNLRAWRPDVWYPWMIPGG